MTTKRKTIKHHGKVIKWQYLWMAQVLLINLFCSFLTSSQVSALSCVDVEFIFARGSGEAVGDKSFNQWQSEIEKRLQNTTLTKNFYELGSDKNSEYQYPAVAVSGGFWDYVNLVATYFSAGEAFAFGASVREGQQELISRIEKVAHECPQTQFVLGGYSQGAMLMTRTLTSLPAEKIVYVTNFGDPKLYLPEGFSASKFKFPDACLGRNLSEYRTYVPNCWAYEGILHGEQPYRHENYTGKVGTWCYNSDIMCSSGMSFSDHGQYIAENLYTDAAQKIYAKLKQVFPDKFPAGKSWNLHDVLFLLDATGSMRDFYNFYYDELAALAHQIYENGGRVAAYGYRDNRYERSSWPFCKFNCTEDEFLESLADYQDAGGNDEKESMLSAAYLAMEELDWQPGATKSIVVVADAAYKEPDYPDIYAADVIRRSLEIDPVNVYIIGRDYMERNCRALIDGTSGKFFGLKDLDDEANLTYNQAQIKASTEYILNRPVAQLNMNEYRGLVGDTIAFDASASRSLNNNSLTYEWDLDGDGAFEPKYTTAKVEKKYDETFDKYIQVRVGDGEHVSTMSARVIIQENLESPAEIEKVTYEKLADDTYEVTFVSSAPEVLLNLNDAVMGFVKSGSGKTRSGNITTFPLKNLQEDTVVTLTPYSASGRRGISASIEITFDSNNNPPTDDNGADVGGKGGADEPDEDDVDKPDEGDTKEKPKEKDQPENSAQDNKVAKPENTTSQAQTDATPQEVTTIPAAPDTGVYDRRFLLEAWSCRELKCQ